MSKTQLILSCFIAGLPHRNPDLSLVAIGDPIRLIAEPQNQYDPDAIQVYHGETLLGYVPREQTMIIHNARENGFTVATTVADIPMTKWKEILIRSYIEL